MSGLPLSLPFSVIGRGVSIGYAPSIQTLHIGVFAALTVLIVGLGYWITRTRRTRGAHLFALTLFALAIRTGSDALQGVVGELWTVLTVLVAINPLVELCTLVLFVRFAGRYAGFERLNTDRTTRAMIGLVAVAALAIATNPVHGLVFERFLEFSTPFTYVGGERAVLGTALAGLNVVLLLVGAGMLAHAVTTGIRPAWWPAVVLSLGVSQAVLVIGLQTQVSGVLPEYDYTSLGLAAFFLLTTLALVEHGLRRIEVVAREEIIDDIDDAVVLLDTDGVVADYNAAASALFEDLAAGEVFADRFDDLDLATIESGPPRTHLSLTPAEAAVAPATDLETGLDDDGPAVPGTGDRHFLVHTEFVTSQTAQVLGHAVRFVETTELERRSRELKRKNQQLDQFASTVSHDLRNPLNVATGYLQMATEAVDPDDDAAFDVDAALAYLEKVSLSLDRMTTIIEDILALIDNADPVTETDAVAFERVARAAWATVDTHDASMTIASAGRIEADESRLQRLLENLFRNAIDHVGEDVAIETGVTDDGFFVADDGPGIPPEDRDQIFEHGYTTGEDGTGLGLSIVQQLADAHGWSLSLDPDHDGAKFVVSGAETTLDPSSESTEA